jgi:hypothetical protein
MRSLHGVSHHEPDQSGGIMTKAPKLLVAPRRGPEQARFRLAGFGGAALGLRSVVVPDDAQSAGARLSLDVELLSPIKSDHYFARPVSDGLIDRLSALFLAAASDWHPELSVPSVSDACMGLELSVTHSDEVRVNIVLRIIEDLEADVRDFGGLDFETSRAALAQAARDVRVLDRGGHDDDGLADPPSEWSSK